MSDINLDFTVSNNSIDFTVQPNEITITPTDIQLTFNPSSPPGAGGSNTELQYNNAGILNGIPTVTYNGSNLSLGNVANVKMAGGTNGYVLQTDGTGNLTWSAAGGSGNGNPGGSNTQIQYNDNGLFGGSTGFTFDKITGNVTVPGTLIGNISGNMAGSLTGLIYGKEEISIISPASGVYNINILSNAIQYSNTTATANVTPNFRGNSTISLNSLLSVGQSITATYVMTTGVIVYNIANIQIDSVAQTIKWVNGLAPTGVANTTTSYTFTLIKTAATPTYTVLGSATRYA